MEEQFVYLLPITKSNGKKDDVYFTNSERVYPNIVEAREPNGSRHLLTQLFFSNGESPIVRVSTNAENNELPSNRKLLEDELRFFKYINEQIKKNTA